MDDRVPLGRTPEEQAEEDAFLALYGEWAPMTPTDLAEEMRGFDRPWWIVGGWAIEAATGFRREHEDTDMSILSCDVPAFVEFMKGRWHVWNNAGGVLHPLGERWPDVDEPRSQLSLRASAKDPWIIDIPLTPDSDGLWTNKFLEGHTAAVEDVTSLAQDGIRYLLPEIVLVYKARLRRPKDDPDFAAALPTLTEGRREWMRDAIKTVAPEHPGSSSSRRPRRLHGVARATSASDKQLGTGGLVAGQIASGDRQSRARRPMACTERAPDPRQIE